MKVEIILSVNLKKGFLNIIVYYVDVLVILRILKSWEVRCYLFYLIYLIRVSKLIYGFVL